MHFLKYSNISKAILHCHNTVHSFYSDVSIEYPYENDAIDLNIDGRLFKFSLFVDAYETHVEITDESILKNGINSDNKNVFRLRIVNYCLLNTKTSVEAYEMNSYVNSSDLHGTAPCLNVITLNPDKVDLYERNINKQVIDMNNLEQEHFQYSTVQNIAPLEDYYHMRDLYHHFSEYIPQGLGLMIKYQADLKYNNDEFREWAAQKIWGIINLA